MKKRIKLILATLILLPLISHAGPTHLDVDNDDMVQLRLTGPSSSSRCPPFYLGQFRVVRTNGQLANQEFRVPAGKELVITDIVWAVEPFDDNWTGRASRLVLHAFIESGFLGTLLFTPLVAEPDSGNRLIGGAMTLTAGARVASNRLLCLRSQSRVKNFARVGSENIRDVEIYGYLVSKQ